jgi:hypothetical protein
MPAGATHQLGGTGVSSLATGASVYLWIVAAAARGRARLGPPWPGSRIGRASTVLQRVARPD